MAEEEKKDEAEKSEKKEKQSPEARIALLEEEANKLREDVRNLHGRVRNRNEDEAKAIKAQNDILEKRIKDLRKVLTALLVDSSKGRSPEQATYLLEIFREHTIEFFKANNIDEGVWTSIAS